MSKILIIHSGLTGISNACLQISNRLEKAKHQVWTSAMKNIRKKAEHNGLEYLDVKPIRFNYKFDQEKNKNKHVFFDQRMKELDFENFGKIIADYEIDLVLIDIELHEYIMYLNTQKISFMLISPWFSIWKTKNNLPPSSKRINASPLQQEILWMFDGFAGQIKRWLHFFKTRGLSRRNFILYLADKLGFDTDLFVKHHFPLPFSYHSLPILSTTHPDLEIGSHTLTNLHYVYPMVDSHRKEEYSIEFKTDFQSIVPLIQSKSKKLIVVTRSSMNKSNSGMIPKLLLALTEIKDCIAIVSLGKWYKDFQHLHNGKNLFLYERIPQLHTLKYAHLSINHGGIHTINECIHFQVPMLVLSGEQFDQNGCAARVHNYGCGIALYGLVKHDQLVKSIKTILEDVKYKLKVDALHSAYIKSIENGTLENKVGNRLKE